ILGDPFERIEADETAVRVSIQARPLKNRISITNTKLKIVDRLVGKNFRLHIGIKLEPVLEVGYRFICLEPLMQLSVAAHRTQEIALAFEHRIRQAFSARFAEQQ